MPGPHPYARIAEDLRRRIDTGLLRPGDRVPSARKLAQERGVALATATRALATLRDQGIVRAVPGVGTVVAGRSAPARGPRTPGTPRRPGTPDTTTADDPDRRRIVRAAVRIADTEGLTALTMRRIATDLDVATMSLYRHVQGKEQLITLMADLAFAEEPLPGAARDWRPGLELAAATQWRLYGRHPWLAGTMSLSRPLLAPHGMRHIEWMLHALDGLGLDDDTRLHTAVTLFGYVRGAAADLEAERQATQDTGVRGQEWLDAQENVLAELASPAEMPAFAAARRGPGVGISVHSLFEFGLARLLDGVAALIGAIDAPRT
ncbi:TetR/AcrR family transcriptional regulator C-terminal domain-containing protein [Streptomyces monticola]|uniref:TetR/AcrR family transcriptional regulator C-terminal domain-containing protein n=1 Tax=Streptomyces monticola TaxID=2666263 RepID=A0ABW2JXN9_9ACTN